MSSSTERAEPTGQALDTWTARTLFARHKAVAIATLALLVLLIAFTASGILTSSAVVVSDSSTCATWSSANYTQQYAYAGLYLREHGSLPSGATDMRSVLAAIDAGCTQSFANDVQDNITVVQAIQQQ